MNNPRTLAEAWNAFCTIGPLQDSGLSEHALSKLRDVFYAGALTTQVYFLATTETDEDSACALLEKLNTELNDYVQARMAALILSQFSGPAQ